MKSTNVPNPAEQNIEGGGLDLIRSILLRDDREQLESATHATHDEIVQLEKRLELLQAQLATLEQAKADNIDVVPAIESALTSITTNVVTSDRQAMADALAPVMGDAISRKISESRDEMVVAFSPIMLGAIQQAINDSFKELQQTIDARLSRRKDPQLMAKRLSAEMQGVTSAEFEMRNALPFSINQIFLIQNESGLLLSHYSRSGESADSDLISAMLTAIRDFVGDAFSEQDQQHGSELQEVQFGLQSIILKSGPAAYCAIVTDGTEPEGLRNALQAFVAQFHATHEQALREFNGDSAIFPQLESELTAFTAHYFSAESPKKDRGLPTVAKAGIGCFLLTLFATLCFSSWFIYSLFPTAIGYWQPTALPTSTQIIAPTAQPITLSTPTLVPTVAVINTATTAPPTETPTPTNTSTPTPTATKVPATSTATSAPLPTATSEQLNAHTSARVWARSLPTTADGEKIFLIERNTLVYVEAAVNEWVRIYSTSASDSGWIMSQWLELDEQIPDTLITPAP